MGSSKPGEHIAYSNPFWSVLRLPIDDRVHYVVRIPDSVCVIARTQDDRYLLVRVYRGAHARTVLEWPGGGVSEGETPNEAASRELEEETGLRVGSVEYIAAVRPATALTTEVCHVVLAAIPATGISAGAEVEGVVLVDREAVLDALMAGGGDAVALAAWTIVERWM